MFRVRLLAAALVLVLVTGYAAENKDALMTFSEGVESRVSEYKLKNGLELLVYVDSAAPVVSANVYYRVGFYYDPFGMSGISHMLEHMTFKHTDVYKPGDFMRIVKQAGGTNNGFTSSLYTGYFEDFARDRWELALKLEAARMGRCRFPDSEFESERQVVAEETRLGENMPMMSLWRAFNGTAFLISPQRNTNWPDDVNRFTVAGIRDWYQRHYNPANAVVVVAGDVRPDDVRAKVERYFGAFKGVPVQLPDYYNIEPKQTGERRVLVHKRIQQPLMMLGYHVPGIRDSGYLASSVAAAVLAGGRSSRLYKALVNETGLASSVYGYSGVERDPDLLSLYITPKAESLTSQIEKVVERELEKVRTELVSDRELQQVRNTVLADKIFARDDVSDMAYFLARFQIANGSWRGFKEELAKTNQVTREQVRDFCREYLVADNRTVGMLLNAKEER
jgi:zinc protease